MSSVQRADDSTGVVGSSWKILDTIRNSALLVLAVIGLLEVLIGYVMHTGVWAALLAVWGSGLILVGVVGYVFIWWQRQ